MECLHTTRKNRIALLTMQHPPVNGLGHSLRSALVAGIQAATADPLIDAIVITGTEKFFSAGADIQEFGTTKALTEPHLHSVIRVIEDCPKPVIAALRGVCMGGGLELALACHCRVASPKASLALPEIKLGLIPGAGGTQRLPRVIGLEKALNFILSGEPLPAIAFQGTLLIDAFLEGDFIAQAIDFARQLQALKKPLPKVRDLTIDYPLHEGFLQFSRNIVKDIAAPYPAALKVIQALSDAMRLPFEEGLAQERKHFLELMNTAESRAMRYAFFAQRNTHKVPDLAQDTPKRDIRKVGIIGAGTMGSAITMNFINVGIPVVLLETAADRLTQGLQTIQRNYDLSIQKNKLSAETVATRLALIQGTLDYADLKDVDLVIEAVFEDMALKQSIFEKLDKVLPPGRILASNTSTLDISALASRTQNPENVLGLHFFSPANVMRLVEIVRTVHTSNEVLASVIQLVQRIHKTPVICRVCDGFIGNRMVEQYTRMAGLLLDQGATPWQIDQALENFGMLMGPFKMCDLAGNDVVWAIRKRRTLEFPDMAQSRFADILCNAGRFGQKTGKGWYLYDKGGRKASPDPEVSQMLSQYRTDQGFKPRSISAQEIVEFCIFALINEGARILEEGIAQRASDIDVVYLTGYGFPIYRGGPLKYADEMGLSKVVQTCLKFYAQTQDPFWQPAQLLKDCLTQAKNLTDTQQKT